MGDHLYKFVELSMDEVTAISNGHEPNGSYACSGSWTRHKIFCLSYPAPEGEGRASEGALAR